MTRLRTVLIGAGRIAQDYIAVLETSHDLQLVAAVDPDSASRQRVAAVGLVPTFAALDELHAADQSFDAALIVSPPATHAELAVKLLESGHHVFCEKPLATSLEDAERMLATAKACDRALMMATKFRFVDDTAIARDIIASGEIGAIAFYANSFCSKVDMTSRWNATPAIAGGGVLIDNGTHSIDLARFLVGPIARVSATFGPRVQPIDVEDSAVVTFETAQQTVGRIELSWSIDKPTEHYVEIHGARGTLQIGWRASRYRTDASGEWTTFGSGYNKQAAFASQLNHFAAVARGEAQPIVTPRDALASVRIVDAAYRAAREGTWEPIHPMEPVA